MKIRKTTLDDLNIVMNFYDNARKFMYSQGNTTQWNKNYPSINLIKADILNGNSYVCFDDNEIYAVFTFIIGDDPTYNTIYHGDWLNNNTYGTIHRICVNKKGCGIGKFCIDYCFNKCHNLRIDTHKNNKAMQSLINKCGFIYCGIIHVSDGSERLAYQKI